MTGKELTKLVPQLSEKLGYDKALAQLIAAGVSETTARKLLQSKYEAVPRQRRIVEALEDVLAKNGIRKAS